MSTYNPGLLYYKHYYENIVWGEASKKSEGEKANKTQFRNWNKMLLQTKFVSENLPALNTSTHKLTPGQSPVFQNFELTTTYPGLILGTGYSHGSNLLGEFKTGFFFDYTTGMPVIPGSSVKGLLRSAFPALYYENAKKYTDKGQTDDAYFWKKLGDNRSKFIGALLLQLGYEAEANESYIKALEYEIFEGMHGTNREKGDQHFAMRERDVFFDAIVVKSADQCIFEEDYITPHKNPLKNPIPIQLLKVRPGVTFQFQFRLQSTCTPDRKNTSRDRILTPEQRLELFRQILLFLGAGAKTNTGYGQFIGDVAKVNLSTQKEEAGTATATSAQPIAAKTAPDPYQGTVSKGAFLEAQITALSPKKRASVNIKGNTYEVGASGNCPSIGTVCKVTVSDFDKKTKEIKMVAYAGRVV